MNADYRVLLNSSPVHYSRMECDDYSSDMDLSEQWLSQSSSYPLSNNNNIGNRYLQSLKMSMAGHPAVVARQVLYSDCCDEEDEEEGEVDMEGAGIRPMSSFGTMQKEMSPSGLEVVASVDDDDDDKQHEETKAMLKQNQSRSSFRSSAGIAGTANNHKTKKKNRFAHIFRRNRLEGNVRSNHIRKSASTESRPTYKLKHPQVLLPHRASSEDWLDRMMTPETVELSFETKTSDDEERCNIEVLITSHNITRNNNNTINKQHDSCEKSFVKTPLLRARSVASFENEKWTQQTITTQQLHANDEINSFGFHIRGSWSVKEAEKPGKVAAQAGKEQLIGAARMNNNNKSLSAATMATPKTEHSPTTMDTSGHNTPESNNSKEVLTAQDTLKSSNMFSELANNLLRDLSWSSSSASAASFSTHSDDISNKDIIKNNLIQEEARRPVLLMKDEAPIPVERSFDVPKTIYVYETPDVETELSLPDLELHEDKFVEDIERRIMARPERATKELDRHLGTRSSMYRLKRTRQHLQPKETKETKRKVMQPKDFLQKLRASQPLLRPPPRHHEDFPLEEVIVPPSYEKGDDDGCSSITNPDYGATDDYESLSFCASDYSPPPMQFLDVD